MIYSRWIALGFSAVFACTSAYAQEGANVKKAQDREKRHVELKDSSNTGSKPKMHVLGHFVKRDKVITILSGSEGRRYTVKSKDGKVLSQGISEKDLLAAHPDLYRFVRSAIAVSGDGNGFIDAAVRGVEHLDVEARQSGSVKTVHGPPKQ